MPRPRLPARNLPWLAVLLGLFGLQLWWPFALPGPVGDSYGSGASGKKAFTLLAQTGWPRVSRNLQPLTRRFAVAAGEEQSLGNRDCLCILGPARQPTSQEWETLFRWVGRGGHLLFAIGDSAVPDSISATGLQVDILPWLDRTAGQTPIETTLMEGDRIEWRADRRLHGRGVEELVRFQNDLSQPQDSVQAIHRNYGRGQIVLVATDWIFTNDGLSRGDNSVLAYRLLEQLAEGRDVLIDEYLNLSGTPIGTHILLTPELRPLTLQLLMGAVLIAWWRSSRTPVPPAPVPQPGIDIVTHANRLGDLLAEANDPRSALATYLTAWRRQVGLPTQLPGTDRMLGIGWRAGMTTDQLRELLDEAEQAAADEDLSTAEAAGWIRELCEIAESNRYVREAKKPLENRSE